MEKRKLGNSDMHITPVGFGAWAVGGAGWAFSWGEQDDKDSIAAIHRATRLGQAPASSPAALPCRHDRRPHAA